MTAESIISTSTTGDASGGNKKHRFGYYEAQHQRPTQEDALSWQLLQDNLDHLSPEEIGHRLWTSYKLLDKEVCSDTSLDRIGCTAATTLYDGKGNLITGVLADAAIFAAIYNKQGEAIGVLRLNSIIQKPGEAAEKERIEKLGGTIIHYGVPRVEGSLAVSRAIGDNYLKQYVCSDAQINITSIDAIKAELIAANPEMKVDDIGSIQLITTCDGFTDAASEQTKLGHETYLLDVLKALENPSDMSEEKLAKCLVDRARKGSYDNISVSVQTLTDKTPALLSGIYDGHGGHQVAHYVANNIGSTIIKQCGLTPAAYAEQELSVDKQREVYNRDNPQESLSRIIQKPKGSVVQPGDESTIEVDEAEIKRIKKILEAFRERSKDPALINSSSPIALVALKRLKVSLDSACDLYEKNLKFKKANGELISSAARKHIKATFNSECRNILSQALDNGLAEDLNWRDYLLNMLKNLLNTAIAQVTGRDQFFTIAKTPLMEEVDSHIKDLVKKPK